ncbi:MAG: cyclic nucleotide-binding domain-containing protein [Desulfobacterales bacterium]|nr:cyclic nucleotide-binding domain-containing protein [Desulfobacterales bacterium]
MFIKEYDLFEGISDEVNEALVDVFESKSFGAGELVFKAGDPADSFYILKSGAVNLYMGGQSAVSDIAIEQGEAFGWSSLVGRDTYSATVDCAVPSKLYKIKNERLEKVLRQYPVVGMNFYRHLASLIGQRVVSSYMAMSKLLNQ